MKPSPFTMTVAGLALLYAGSVAAQTPTGGSGQPAGTPSAPAPSSTAPGSEPARSEPPSPAGAQPQVQVDAGSIIGSPVRGADGRDVGKVDRLMVDPKDGRISTVVISMGGTLGMGGRNVSVPWQSVRIGQDQGRLVVMVDQQFLEPVPAASPSGERERQPSQPQPSQQRR
ncbi:MAG TPA: PRC-barrel domain-containing protein [Candidatus Binatia bacterium]|nr:PRC-barrel domain-containing protein [Candidatus Binatia bacterium]